MSASLYAHADGSKLGFAHGKAGVPPIRLETALPAKFEATLKEALGRPPKRPVDYENVETLPQRCGVMDVDAEAVKRFIDMQ